MFFNYLEILPLIGLNVDQNIQFRFASSKGKSPQFCHFAKPLKWLNRYTGGLILPEKLKKFRSELNKSQSKNTQTTFLNKKIVRYHKIFRSQSLLTLKQTKQHKIILENPKAANIYCAAIKHQEGQSEQRETKINDWKWGTMIQY